MRKLLLALCLLALLAGCAPRRVRKTNPDPEPLDLPAEWLALTALEHCGREAEELERLDRTRDQETLSYYLTELYGLPPDSWEDCALYRAGGAEAFEVAVLRLGEDRDAQTAVEGLSAYIAAREGDFAGYEPEEAALVRQSVAGADGPYVALLICPEAERVLSALWETRRRYPFTPPGKDDMTLYDTSAILTAWETGDAAGLSEEEWEILNAADQILMTETTPEMSPLERERAVYRWLTSHVTYDQDHYDALAKLDPASSTPYGPLVNGKGICIGFATAFQLLMDMAEVECITVVGASFDSAEDHAWNMVRLGGRWHCVDVTWDQGAPEGQWRFFNVSSARMAETDHQWAYASVPEAAP